MLWLKEFHLFKMAVVNRTPLMDINRLIISIDPKQNFIKSIVANIVGLDSNSYYILLLFINFCFVF